MQICYARHRRQRNEERPNRPVWFPSAGLLPITGHVRLQQRRHGGRQRQGTDMRATFDDPKTIERMQFWSEPHSQPQGVAPSPGILYSKPGAAWAAPSIRRRARHVRRKRGRSWSLARTSSRRYHFGMQIAPAAPMAARHALWHRRTPARPQHPDTRRWGGVQGYGYGDAWL